MKSAPEMKRQLIHRRFVRRIELASYPVWAAFLDGTLTLAGQPSSYLAGDFATANELNPIGYMALATSPWIFGIGLLLWMVAFCSVSFYCRELIATRISLTITAFHLLGAATWLLRMKLGILWVILLASFFRFLIYPRFFPVSERKAVGPDE